METLHCKVCHTPLPEGKEHPEYFGQSSTGHTSDGDRLVEDISQALISLDTLKDALWAMHDLADSPNKEGYEAFSISQRIHYLETARSLCFLMTEFLNEEERNIDQLRKWIGGRIKEEEAEADVRHKASLAKKGGN